MPLTDETQPVAASPPRLAVMDQVFDKSPVAIAVTSVSGRLERVNAAMCALLGYTDQELVGRTFAEITHPDDVAASTEAAVALLAGHASDGRFAKRYIAKSGKLVWADTSIALIRHPTGEPSHFVTHIVDVSEQRNVERKWQTLFENAADGVFVADPAGRYLEANPAALRMVGMTIEELRQVRIVDVIDPDDLALHPLKLTELARDGGVTSLRKLRRKDGSTVHAEIAGRRMPDGLTIGLVRDVGARERDNAVVRLRWLAAQLLRDQPVEVVLRHVLRQVLQLVDSDRGSVHVFDRAGKVLYHAWFPPETTEPPQPLLTFLSRAFALPTGDEPASVLGIRRLVVPVAGEGAMSVVVQAGGKQVPYGDDDRETLAAFANAMGDVLTRHRAEQFLQATVDRLALASEVARIGVWDIDLATGVVTWDDHMYGLFGVDPPQPGREHEVWASALTEQDRLQHDALVQRALSLGEDLHTDIKVRTPAGEERILEAHSRAQRGADGRPLHLVGLNIDVTARRRDEAELRRHRDHLDELVRARTLELDRSNRELEQFAMVASHDLKAPLRTIEALANLLTEEHATQLDAEGQEMLGHIGTSAARMQAMTDSLLTYSRLTTRAVPSKVVDMAQIAAQVAAELAPSARAVGGRIAVGPLPAAFGDPTQLHQLLQNLVANGLKFARPGVPPLVQVAGELRGDRLRLTVDDNGIGIAPEHRQRVFDMFERLHGAHRYEGSGIGLAICKKVVERLGGTIAAEGLAEPGTRMVVELPTG